MNNDEFNSGWEQGIDDFLNGIHCRFEEGHSEFAMGYYGGYCYVMNFFVED